MADADKAKDLGEKLKAEGVGALYLGDKDHNSTAIGFHIAKAIIGFHPDLLFEERSYDCQPDIDKDANYLLSSNSGFEALAAIDVGAKIIAVDDSKKDKAKLLAIKDKYESIAKKMNELTEEVNVAQKGGDVKKVIKATEKKGAFIEQNHQQLKEFTAAVQKRVSPETNGRIAGRIADKVGEFFNQNGYMPSFAISLGAGHIAQEHDINEMVREKLKEKGLPGYQEKNLKIVKGEKGNKITTVTEEKTGGFDYTLITSDIPIPPSLDIRNLTRKPDTEVKSK